MSRPVISNPSDERLPSREAIVECFALSTLPETAEYLSKQYEKKLIKAGKLEEGQEILARIRDFVSYVFRQNDRSDSFFWGEEVISFLKNFHLKNEAEALTVLTPPVFNREIPLRIDFAAQGSEFQRLFSSNNQALNPEAQKAIDDLFNACLVKNNMLSENGTIYQVDQDGRKGAPASEADIDHFTKNTFAAFLKENNMSTVIYRQPFHVEQAAAAAPTKAPPTPAQEAPQVSTPQAPTEDAPQA